MPSLPSLYAILDIDTLNARGLDARAVLDVWLDAGIRLIQLRAKHLDNEPLIDLAHFMVERTRAAHAALIINDRADIALLTEADGVHVGQDDASPTKLIELQQRFWEPVEHDEDDEDVQGDEDDELVVPAPLLIGLSTHTLDQLRVGMAEPSDYLAIGPVFSTVTKLNASPVVGLTVVTEAAKLTAERPLVAIGGITLQTAPAVLAAGADAVAVISDLLNGDIKQRAREFVAICR